MSRRRATEHLVAAPTMVEEAGRKYGAIDHAVTRRLLGYMLRHRRLQVAIVLFALVLAAINAAVPLVMTETVRLTIEHPERWRELTGLSATQGVLVGAGLLGLLALAYYVIMRIRMVAINDLSERVVYDLRRDIFAQIHRLDIAFFDRTKLGRILSRGTGDVMAVRHAVAQVIPRTLIHGLEVVFALAAMLVYDLLLAGIVLLMGPVLYLINNHFRRRMGDAYRRVQESFSRITANLAESISGMRVTQAFTREGHNAGLFRDLLLMHQRNNIDAAVQHGLYIPMLDLASQVTAVVVLVVGAARIVAGDMGVADMLGFLFFSGRFFLSITVIAELYNTTLQAMAGGERIFELLDRRPRIVDPPEPVVLARRSAGLRVAFEEVGFRYAEDGPEILAGIEFAAEPGETVALVGHTGAGKTTIINLVCRFYDATAGRVTMDGVPVGDLQLASLRAQLGLVQQENFLFKGTVADNIRIGRPSASDEEVRRAAEDLGCLDLFDALPAGLATEVGERGTSLSLGQRQLVCFARALIADPGILILDEATSAVDAFSEHRIQTALERLLTGRTCLVVAHRLSTVRRADQILVLDHGEIVERGRHEDLVATGGVYARLHEEFVRVGEP